MALHVFVIKETELEDPQDLRARSRKFLNLTNERKNMSTKTNFKRIALVAVTALGAGLLSVAPASATGVLSGTGQTGVITAYDNTGDGTATLVVGGTLTLGQVLTTSTVNTVTVSGGLFTSITSGGTVDAAGTTASSASGAAIVGLVVKATTAGTNMVIKSYAGSATVVNTITVTVVASGLAGVYSAGDSLISIIDDSGTTALVADTPYANIIANGDTGLISYELNDGLGLSLASTTIVYANVASGKCVVGLADAPVAGTMVVGTAPDDVIYVAQDLAAVDTPQTCSVDISVNGTKVSTKTFTFQGAVASVAVSSIGRGKTSTANTGLGYLVALDSAGNAIGNVTVTGAIVNAADAAVVSAVSVAAVTTRRDAGLNAGTAPATVPVTIGWTCTATSSEGVKIKFKSSNGTGGYIYSPEYTATCGGDPANYTASFDKASYVPGDIATLTITGKDSKAVLTNDAAVVGTDTTYEVAIAGSNLTAVTTPQNEDTFTAGVKTYKFIVGATEGSYQLVVNLPKWNSTTYSQSALAVSYKIAASSTTVSNADVLKAIVSLIASINKQIAALQKALLKK